MVCFSVPDSHHRVEQALLLFKDVVGRRRASTQADKTAPLATSYKGTQASYLRKLLRTFPVEMVADRNFHLRFSTNGNEKFVRNACRNFMQEFPKFRQKLDKEFPPTPQSCSFSPVVSAE